MERQIGEALLDIYRRLFDRYGAQHWWPGESPFEVIVGAILTQSATWTNVEKAIANLKEADALSPAALRELDLTALARLIRPSGYYNAKSRKLKAFVEWLGEKYEDDLDRVFSNPIPVIREQLLSIYGIGEETADSILLYAGNKPLFVIDAYTRRVASRCGLAPAKESYSSYQRLFAGNLPTDVALFNEYHALLVRLGKEVCHPHPLCPGCCLRDICRYPARRFS